MRSDALRRRQAILAAARTVFVDGPNSGTLEEVARVAKVGIATVYRNFRDKDALLIAMIDELLGRILEVQEASISQFETDPTHALHDYAHGLHNLGLAPLLFHSSEATIHQVLPHFADTRQQLIENNRRIIDLSKSHQQVKEDITSPLFIAGLFQAARPASHTILPTIEDIEKRMIDFFLAGIRP